MKDTLKDIWVELLHPYVSVESITGKLWQEIVDAYEAKGRYYHTLQHIEYLVNHAFIFRDQLQDFGVVLFSIFYHDIVYDPLRNDNEERSSQFARERLKVIGLAEERIKNCVDQILATKDHESIHDQDCDYFLDFDLAILGEEPDLFRAHSLNVRKEYSHLSDPVFYASRRKVLESFLHMPRIYKTEPFYEKYEARAIENIRSEIYK